MHIKFIGLTLLTLTTLIGCSPGCSIETTGKSSCEADTSVEKSCGCKGGSDSCSGEHACPHCQEKGCHHDDAGAKHMGCGAK